MTTQPLSRRAFLRAASASASKSLLVLSVPSPVLAGREASAAMASGKPLSTLGAEEAAEFEAIAARIIPTDETPGAREAGVIYFMDNLLGSSRPEVLPELRAGLAALQTRCWVSFSSLSFSALAAEQQDALLHEIETTAFFETLRFLTIAGMFTMPARGGNRDRIGWQLIGFEDRHFWQPPFGYYDADYMEKGA